ncbi:DUF3108 domain-containing protein [candidate division KSB1 bacterium]|nr:DUF3108 domain-containing protein [candidate division KSB1 bacterium]
MLYCFFSFIIPVQSDEQDKGNTCYFCNGETLKYNMKFNGMSTAQSILYAESEDPPFLEINWDLHSKTVYKLLFYVDNHYYAKVDMNIWLPVKLAKKVKQKNIKQSFETVYDRKRLIAQTDNGLQWPIKNNCMDLFSMLYHLRTRELAPGDSLIYILDIESHVWKLTGKVREGEKVKGPFQDLNIRQVDFSFTPELPVKDRTWKTDLFTNRISQPDTKLTVCLGPPPEKLPVFLKFETKKTSVEMLLDEYSLKK